MFLWSTLFTMSLYLTCAEITTEPSTTLKDYYNYVTFAVQENELMNETEPSMFDLSIYNSSCSEDENDTRQFCEKFENDLRETCGEFHDVVKNMIEFSCSLSEYVADVAMNTSNDYLNSCEQRLTCAESVGIVKKLMTGLLKCNATEMGFMNLAYTINDIMILKKLIGPMNQTYVWKLIINNQQMLVDDLGKYVHNVNDLLKYLNDENLTNIFLTQIFTTRTNLPYLKLKLQQQSEHLLYCQEQLDLWKSIDMVRYDIRLTIFIIFFIVGMTGNLILLTVFIKYPDMRTIVNIMLINLTLVDCICLVLNLPLAYLKTTTEWPLGVGGCQAFYFLRYTSICVSTYSVVMISVQRFLAVTRFPTAGGCTIGEKTKSILMLLSVWLLGVLYSLPRLIFSEIVKDMCSDVNDGIIGIITTTDMIIICMVPAIVILAFSCLTATKIKKSVSNPTGERVGQEQLRQNRMISAHVLSGLAVLFVVSYFPSFLLYFITFQVESKLGTFELYVVDTLTYILQFANSCLNPIALCVMSRKYRKYFQEVLSCCKVPFTLKKSLAASDVSVSTTESAI